MSRPINIAYFRIIILSPMHRSGFLDEFIGGQLCPNHIFYASCEYFIVQKKTWGAPLIRKELLQVLSAI